MGNQGTLQEIQIQGFKNAFVLPTDTSSMTESEFDNFEIDEEVRAVVSAPHAHFDFRKLAIASLYLGNPDVQFVATNDDPVFVSGGSGRLQPDVGATLLAAEVASGRKAVRVGKPEKFCMKMILNDYFQEDKQKWEEQSFLDQFLMVGDNLETDIQFGKNVNIRTCFVYSGISTYPPTERTLKLLD